LATGNAGINRWQNISQRQNNEVVNSNGNFVYVDAIETRAQLFIGVRPSEQPNQQTQFLARHRPTTFVKDADVIS
jgi:hypothetical protein